jgi:hypothetical protein
MKTIFHGYYQPNKQAVNFDPIQAGAINVNEKN